MLDHLSTHTVTLQCTGRARAGSLIRRVLLWAAGCCLRGVALEVDGLACVLGQAGEPGPVAGATKGGSTGDPADLGGRDALVLEVRRVALLPCGGEILIRWLSECACRPSQSCGGAWTPAAMHATAAPCMQGMVPCVPVVQHVGSEPSAWPLCMRRGTWGGGDEST